MSHDPYCPMHRFQQKLMLMVLLITSFATATNAAEDTTLKSLPKEGKPRLDLTIQTDATSGMVDPNSPVKNSIGSMLTSGMDWEKNILHGFETHLCETFTSDD